MIRSMRARWRPDEFPMIEVSDSCIRSTEYRTEYGNSGVDEQELRNSIAASNPP